jgi:hypothetical protein
MAECLCYDTSRVTHLRSAQPPYTVGAPRHPWPAARGIRRGIQLSRACCMRNNLRIVRGRTSAFSKQLNLARHCRSGGADIDQMLDSGRKGTLPGRRQLPLCRWMTTRSFPFCYCIFLVPVVVVFSQFLVL